MSVVLRHGGSGYYYGGRSCWVAGPGRAVDLGTIERAAAAGRVENFGGIEIVVSFDEPECELVLPLGRAGAARGKAASAASGVAASTLSVNLAGGSTPAGAGKVV